MRSKARAIPRTKPPHTVIVGLWGKPTLVNNVETLANVPYIIRNGAEAFKALSLTEEGGTKLYGISGRVRRRGIWSGWGRPWARFFTNTPADARRYQFRGRLGGASTSLTEEH
jgi:NADH-quinone oxidoreductase subunit F